jgi:cold shock CspA family protein
LSAPLSNDASAAPRRRPDHGDDDVFCHRTAIVGADSLPTGTRVTYKLEHNPHRPGTYLAADVTALGAKPVPQPSAGKVLHHLPEAAVNQKGGKKVALVVGISRYRSCPLKNPVNDANAVARKLKSMGFTVTVLLDCPEPVLSKAVRTFTDSLSKSVSAAVFFFAGHGCEYQNQNFVRRRGSNRTTAAQHYWSLSLTPSPPGAAGVSHSRRRPPARAAHDDDRVSRRARPPQEGGERA